MELIEEFLISFFGPLLGGEPVFIMLAFFSGQKILSVWILFLAGTLANILYDISWFLIPRLSVFKKAKVPEFIIRRYKKANKSLKKVEEHELFFVIFGSKFIIGTRNITLISISLNKIKFKRFLFDSAVCSILWGFMIIIVGWLAGKGFTIIEDIFKDTKIALTAILVFFIIFLLIRGKLHKHVHKKWKKRKELKTIFN
ncbi:MAG: hypothetical protein Q8N99_01405 [Nanoarchaeota archaeon]|nr:hypothetical protein [Nanoarchaeota archaeon]